MAKKILSKREREKLFKDVAKKVKLETKKERRRKLSVVKGEFARALPSRATGKKRLKKLKAVPTRLKGTKQPKFATAATKLTSAFLPPGALTGAAPSTGAVDSGRGRGRPTGTYKARYVPGVGVVRVPTHVYKKMISSAKAKQRLAAAQQQAQREQQMEAESIAMQQDPRFQSSADDGFLEEPDMEHEQRVEQMRQQQLMQQQMQQAQQRAPQQQFPQQHATLGSKLKSIIRGNRQSQFGEFQEQPQTSPQQFQQPQQMFAQREGFQRPNTVNPNLHRPANPHVRILGNQSNILNSPSLFGRREGPPIGFKR